MRYSLAGTVVRSCPNWHKTAIKFHRIRCTICLTSPDNHQKKKTTPESRVPAWILVHVVMPLSWQKLQVQKEVSECSAQLHSVEMHSTGFTKDSRSSENLQKRWITVRPSVALYITRITRLKSVNSEVNSVDIDPNWGCLNWPYRTMSESP